MTSCTMQKKIVLIAGMGTSPAVLTETVWALCHQKKPMVSQRGNPVTFPMGRINVLNCKLGEVE